MDKDKQIKIIRDIVCESGGHRGGDTLSYFTVQVMLIKEKDAQIKDLHEIIKQLSKKD